MCARHGVKLCVDCISSLGTMPVDLEGIWLASCSSGKGLRAFPGLGLVFFNHELKPSGRTVPRYLDLELYARSQGIAFTHSSNLVHALHAAVKRVDWDQRFAELSETDAWLRPRLRELGFALVGDGANTSPAVMTLALPRELDSVKVGSQIHEAGFLVSCNSDYLRGRNWIQICLMGEFQREKLVALLNHLNRVCFRRAPGKATTEKPAAAVPTKVTKT
jgi:aspartate aminotransferase-like enzyme